MSVFDHPEFAQHEQITFVVDEASGLRAVNAIHRLRSGVAGGGVRYRPYASDDDALTDVLRLSKAMTYKMVLADLPAGGAKTVIMGDPNEAGKDAKLRALGRFIEGLGGRYLAGPDVGTNEDDMNTIGETTRFVAGKSDQSGSTAGPTAVGLFNGLKATAQAVFGSDDLAGRRVAVQGLGGVGGVLVDRLLAAGAIVVGADVAPVQRSDIDVVSPDEILFVDADILSPNAIGAILTTDVVAKLNVAAVCGAANNQLADAAAGVALAELGIHFAPDYVVNAGGAISGTCDLGLISAAGRDERLERIYDTTLAILNEAAASGRSSEIVAAELANQSM